MFMFALIVCFVSQEATFSKLLIVVDFLTRNYLTTRPFLVKLKSSSFLAIFNILNFCSEAFSINPLSIREALETRPG